MASGTASRTPSRSSTRSSAESAGASPLEPLTSTPWMPASTSWAAWAAVAAMSISPSSSKSVTRATPTPANTGSMAATVPWPPCPAGPERLLALQEAEGGVDGPEVLRRREVVGAPENREAGVGEGLGQRFPGAAEVLVPDDHEDGDGDAGALLGGEEPQRCLEARQERLPVDVGLRGQTSEVVGGRVGGVASGFHRSDHDVASRRLEEVPAHPEGDDPPEPRRRGDGHAEQQAGPHREPDGVDGFVGETLGDVALEVGVGGRVDRKSTRLNSSH